MASSITRDRLRELAELRPERGRVLSVFLNLDPTEFATPPARASAVTSVLTEASHRIDEAELDHADREGLRGDLERVREVLGGFDLAANGTRGIAVYACAAADLLEVVRLARPVESRVVLDDSPFVEPLVHQGDGERWRVLLCNRRSARVFEGDGEHLEETDRIEDNVHSQHDQGGWSQARFQRSVDHDVEEHLNHVASVLFDAFKLQGFEHLLIGAPEETVGDLEAALHPYLRERLAGRLQLDVENSGIEEVRAAVAEAVEAHRTRREREALDRLEAGVGRGDRGAAGLSDVLTALNEARVEILLVADGLRAQGYRDRGSGLIVGEDREGPVDGSGLEPVEDVIEAAIEKAIEQAATVLVVRRHDDLERHGGIGAVLRY